MLLLLIVCTFELIFMMGLGDFCMDPTASVVNAIENNKLASTAKYFGECNPNDSSVLKSFFLFTLACFVSVYLNCFFLFYVFF